MIRREAIGNRQMMTGVPAPTVYHRWLGWRAPDMRRALTVITAGLIVAAVLLPFVAWGLAPVGAGTNMDIGCHRADHETYGPCILVTGRPT